MKKEIIILAAGVGSRLRPITDNVPKTMVQIHGESIIERILLQLGNIENVDLNIKIVTGYKSDKLINFINELDLKKNVEYIENDQFDITNNMYSLHLAIENRKEDIGIVIINADCIYEDEIVRQMVSSSGNYIAVDKMVYNDESMKIKVNSEGRIIEMSKTIEKGEGVYVSMDIYTFDSENSQKLNRIVSETISSGDRNSWSEVAIDILVKSPYSEIKFMDMTGKKWMEIDNHEDLAEAERIFNKENEL